MTERLVPTITIVTNIWIISKPGELRRHTHGVLGSHLRHWIRAGARPGREDLELVKISRDGITWLFSLVAAQNRGVALCRASNTFTPTWSSGRSILVCWWWWWFSKLMPICLNLNPRRTEKSGQKPWRSLLFIFSRKPLSHFLYSFWVTASQAWLQRATNWQADASGARQGGRRSIHTNTHVCHT